MGRFQFEPTSIPDVVQVRIERHEDARGYFEEVYRESLFRDQGIPGGSAAFVQDNVAASRRGVLRGLHFQLPPSAQGKLVGVLDGSIFDVCVDLRRSSPTFGRWVGATLSSENRELLWVPPGFAHGYQVLTEKALVHYKVTAEYDPDREGGLRWDDPRVSIEWPLADPAASDRDLALPLLEEMESTLPEGSW